ncbi:MAG: phage tail tape measure protein, partial [Clostridia bacterium]
MIIIATLKAMFRLFDGYSTTVDKINKKTNDATNKILKASGSTDKFNKKLEATGASANVASGGLGKFIGTAALIAGAIKGMGIVDEFTNTSARLNLINDGLQTQAELQEKIFDAANRSKGAYGSMASAISKMGL